MKVMDDSKAVTDFKVAPLVGAWIESVRYSNYSCSVAVAPLVGAWIERDYEVYACKACTVAPLVGAWIERTAIEPATLAPPGRSSCRSVD